jgi:DNA-binding NarL/FixJ family response regulator
MKLNILVIGRHASIMEVILRLINGQPDWQAKGSLTDEEALVIFADEAFDLVLIGGGVEEDDEKKLTAAFKVRNPAIKVMKHYGGGSGLLFNEILQATNP